MKNRMITLAVFGLTLAGGGAIIVSNALAKTPAAAHTAERHPELRKALNQLEAAKRTMRDAAWDFGYHGTSNVVDQYMTYLRKKIDVPFGRHDLETVRGIGYRLRHAGQG